MFPYFLQVKVDPLKLSDLSKLSESDKVGLTRILVTFEVFKTSKVTRRILTAEGKVS
jgi:hypothetical protein